MKKHIFRPSAQPGSLRFGISADVRIWRLGWELNKPLMVDFQLSSQENPQVLPDSTPNLFPSLFQENSENIKPIEASFFERPLGCYFAIAPNPNYEYRLMPFELTGLNKIKGFNYCLEVFAEDNSELPLPEQILPLLRQAPSPTAIVLLSQK